MTACKSLNCSSGPWTNLLKKPELWSTVTTSPSCIAIPQSVNKKSDSSATITSLWTFNFSSPKSIPNSRKLPKPITSPSTKIFSIAQEFMKTSSTPYSEPSPNTDKMSKHSLIKFNWNYKPNDKNTSKRSMNFNKATTSLTKAISMKSGKFLNKNKCKSSRSGKWYKKLT